MNKRMVGLLLILLIPSVLADNGSLWQKYDWYILGIALLLLLYVLFKVAKKLIFIGLIVAAVVIAGNLLLERNSLEIGVVGELHYHTDFALYINGERYDFAQERYMSKEDKSLSNFAHFHDRNGNLIHKHASGVTLGFFLETLDIKLNDTCLVLDDGASYCNEGNEELKMYVNGRYNDEFAKYDFHDEDRILLSYGDESKQEIEEQLQSVTDEACIYSLTCPERGTPPEEATCVGETCVVEN